MNLPESDRAFVASVKAVEYLLAEDHPDGGPKARFFTEHGFRQDQSAEFVDALLRHGRENQVILTRDTPWGMRYTVQGTMRLPDGSEHVVWTVWQFDLGTDFPRLLTAHAV
ncbi:MAG: hypothetical protein OXC55_03895 [Chloroflexi bacterium]|nr:hypothetical protein [Chloroflexota bacterium]